MEKIVSLCGSCSQCRVVRVKEGEVEIGEEGNLCVLTREEFEALKKKILEGEL